MKVVAIVGMAGAGKSEVARHFERAGYARIRFGDVTDDEVRRRGLQLSEESERRVRELLRKELGMAAYARLNLPRIDAALKTAPVVIDGLYSWEEYTFLKEHYGEDLCLVVVWASPETRYTRLGARRERPLTREEAVARDRAEVENSNKGGPIAMADFLVVNESSLEELARQVEKVEHRIEDESGGKRLG
jgi:dephospho-CoA kinase